MIDEIRLMIFDVFDRNWAKIRAISLHEIIVQSLLVHQKSSILSRQSSIKMKYKHTQKSGMTSI